VMECRRGDEEIGLILDRQAPLQQHFLAEIANPLAPHASPSSDRPGIYGDRHYPCGLIRNRVAGAGADGTRASGKEKA